MAPKFTKLCVADVLPWYAFSSCRLQSPRDKTLFSTIAQKLQDRIQAYADERFEYRDAEQTDLQPLMYATASERKDDAMALSLYAVRIFPPDFAEGCSCPALGRRSRTQLADATKCDLSAAYSIQFHCAYHDDNARPFCTGLFWHPVP